MSDPLTPPPDQISPSTAKDPVLLLVLAFLLGGLAYFVLGQWQKGLAASALWVCSLAFAIITCGIGSTVFFPVWLLTVVDVYMQAKVLKDGSPIGQWTFFSQPQ